MFITVGASAGDGLATIGVLLGKGVGEGAGVGVGEGIGIGVGGIEGFIVVIGETEGTGAGIPKELGFTRAITINDTAVNAKTIKRGVEPDWFINFMGSLN